MERRSWAMASALLALSLVPLGAAAADEDASPDDVNAALIDAAWANDVTRAGELIAEGADVNHKDRTEQSAYLIATSEGYDELLDLTLANGADVTSLDSFRGTGLIRSAERGHASIVGRLLQEGIDVDHINRLGWTALHEAIILGDGSERYIDTVRALVAGGTDVALETGAGRVPLEVAASRGQEAVAATLRATLTDQPIDDPDAALLSAAAAGDADAVALALRAGANLESRDDRGRTALLRAALDDHLAVARLLIVLGADPSIADRDGVTPLGHAETSSFEELAAILAAAAPSA